MQEEGKEKEERKASRFHTSFGMKFDAFHNDIVDRIAQEENMTRPGVVREAVNLLFL